MGALTRLAWLLRPQRWLLRAQLQLYGLNEWTSRELFWSRNGDLADTLLTGEQLLRAIAEQGRGPIHAHVVLRGKEEAEETLRRLPEGLRIRGCLFVLGAGDAALDFPARLTVDGALRVAECCRHATLSFGEGLHVGSDLDLFECANLTSLPPGTRVGGDLEVKNTSLTSLPEGLEVDGDAMLHGCSVLASLPGGIRVGGSLDLSACCSLTSLPDDLLVGTYLDLEYCLALESLPASILEWPQADGKPHHIYLGGSGLSAEALEWLRQAEAPGLCFHVSLGTVERRQRRPAFPDLDEAAAFWANEAGQDVARMSLPADGGTLVRFLGRLRDAKEFGIAGTRKALAKRVVAVLELLAEDVHVHEELLLRMDDSLDACGDKPVWALNQMHLVAEVATARGDREALRALGKRVMRLMVVHKHAKRKVDALSFVDDVCVYLRFEIELREALDLPVDASAMIFPSYIKVETKELEAAKTEALAITEAQFEAWLAEWPEWQRQERREVASKLSDWASLPQTKLRRSVRGRLSRRLSQLVGVTGDKMNDPVQLNGAIWSLRDLLQHWERTGLDLHNSVVSPDLLRRNLRRAK